MNFTPQHRRTVQAILDRTYTPLDVREFVQFCYLLAVPLVRSKIHRRKLNLEILGLKEIDVVYDCLADLFRRDSDGGFVHVDSFFTAQGLDPVKAHEDEILLALRRLVFGRVHCSLIRLYSDADPALGKILRNIMLDLEHHPRFESCARFSETFLVPKGSNPYFGRPPLPQEYLRARFAQVASVRDAIPAMIDKLHVLLLEESLYQRAVPLVGAGLLFKEVYAVGEGIQETVESEAVSESDREDISRMAEHVCRVLSANMRAGYVGKGKRRAEDFERYIETVRDILLGEFGYAGENGGSYFEHLRSRMPGLTKAQYLRRHRTVLEYLAKQAKKRMRDEFNRT
jgi:hypothetical protein